MILLQMSGYLVHILLSQVHYQGMRDFGLKASIRKCAVFLVKEIIRVTMRSIGDHRPFRVRLDLQTFLLFLLGH